MTSQHAVMHFEIAGPAAKGLQDFYSKLFGWTINADNPMNYGLVFTMDGGIGGGILTPDQDATYVTFYVTCGTDVDGVFAKALELGATSIIEPMDPGPPAPRLAMFADPDGNMIGLINGTPDEEPPVRGGGAPVSWFEVAGTDTEKTQTFYANLFGWKIDADNEMQYGMTDAIGKGIGGGVYGGADEPNVTIYVAVPDLDATLAKANELGGKTTMEPADVTGGPRIAQFSDPAGNKIGLLIPMQAGGA